MPTDTVLICGDRNWKNEETIYSLLLELQPKTVVTGGCRGADERAEKVAKKLGIKTITYPANWTDYGKAAGPRRNALMLKVSNPDIVVAFHGDIENSKGTKHMVKLARAKGVTVKIIPS